jgi:TonB family protein
LLLALGALIAPPAASAQPAPPAPASEGGLTLPVLTRYSAPVYPEAERRAGREAVVILRLELSREGRVVKATVKSSGGAEFDAAALAAAPGLLFEPARKQGRPVRAAFDFRYTFTIDEVEVARPLPRDEPPPPPEASDEPAPEPAVPGAIDVDVVAERPPREVTKRTLTRREIERIPGTRGDALRSVQSLPGVARVPGEIGLLLVRGSAAGDTQTFIDGTPVPLIYHFGGLSSVVPTEMIDRIDFFPGNFSARYGRGQGGIVEAGLRSPRSDGYHGLAQIDLIDARLMAEGPIPFSKSWSFAAAGRRSHLDAWLGPLARSAGAGVTQAPVYYDYQFMVEGRRGDDETFRTTIFGSDDSFALVVPPTQGNPALTGTLDFHTAFQRLQLRYENRAIDDEGGRFVALLAGGREVVEVELAQAFFLIEVLSITGRMEITKRLSRGVLLNTGTDILHGPVEVRLRAPIFGGGAPIGSRPVREIELTRQVSFPGAYAELELAPSERAKIIPGVRIDYYNITRQIDVSPRVNARYAFVPDFPRTTGKVGVGVYQQPPSYQQVVPPLGNSDLRSNTSIHYGLGLEQEITRQLSASGELFYKQLEDQVDIEQSDIGQGVVRYDNGTRGYAVGGEFLLKYAPDERFFGWIAYTLSRSARQDRPDSPELLVNFDQTHNLTALGSLRLGDGWEFGARFRLVSGNMATPVVCDPALEGCDPNRIDGLYHGFTGSYVALPRDRERERLPLFHQLDVRVDKGWQFESWKFSAYLDIYNVYNNRNIEGIGYNFNYTLRAYTTGIPILPSFGLRGEF